MWRPGDVRSQHTPEHPDPEGIHRPILINLLGPLPYEKITGSRSLPQFEAVTSGYTSENSSTRPGWVAGPLPKHAQLCLLQLPARPLPDIQAIAHFLGLWVSCGMYTAHGGIAHGMRRCYLYQVLLVGQCCSFGVVSRVAHHYIPSGKLTVGYEKSQYLIGI